MGRIVNDEWQRTQIIRKNVRLDEYIIMPNHLHGIINIKNVGAYCNTPLQKNGFQSPSQTFGSIIRGFKSATTYTLHLNGLMHFEWQRSFYDHIIRSEKSLYAIRNYIKYNPYKWEEDEYIVM